MNNKLTSTDSIQTKNNILPHVRSSSDQRSFRKQIIVIGGYGTVGQRICQRLSQTSLQHGYVVYAAGRNLQKAEEFSRAANYKIQALYWDVTSAQENWPDLSEAVLVIMCLDQDNTEIVQYCLQQNIHYMDITANGDFLKQVDSLSVSSSTKGSKMKSSIPAERFGQQVSDRKHSSIALFSVGLAPGITNLLAAALHQRLQHTERIDIAIVLGLGEQHGEAAVRWTVEQLEAAFTIMEKGQPVIVKSMTDGQTIHLQHPENNHLDAKRQKRVYRFPFSDQQTLVSTLQVASVSTRLGFDSMPFTRLLAGLQLTGLLKALRFKPIKEALIWMIRHMHAGTDRFAIRIDASGIQNGQTRELACVLEGSSQSAATAELTALVAYKLLTMPHLHHGVYHLEQLFSWDELFMELKDNIPLQLTWIDQV